MPIEVRSSRPTAGGSSVIPETENVLKGDGAGGASAAIPGTDYMVVFGAAKLVVGDAAFLALKNPTPAVNDLWIDITV